MRKFNLAELLADGKVPDLGTTRERMEYIDIDLLQDDPGNFYSLDGIDGLAANIELIGLQQPIRVRPAEGDGYVVVSGHRRKTALRLLVDAGHDELRQIPCIVERVSGSEAMRELRLIYANADTRRMTSADIAKQAERVQMLLYQLKEEGMDFPGRMRDHVAMACQVSKSKLARLAVIRKSLIPDLMAEWEADKLSEATAYALAQAPADVQQIIYNGSAGSGRELYEGYVKALRDEIDSIKAVECPKAAGSPCAHASVKCAKVAGKAWDYMSTTACARCCANCVTLTTCKDACGMCAEERAAAKKAAAEAKASAKAADEAAKERRRQEEATQKSMVEPMWRRFDAVLADKGLTADDVFSHSGLPEWRRRGFNEARGDGRALPLGMQIWELDPAIKISDYLGVSIDYLLGRPVPESDPEWRSGADEVPASRTEVVMLVDIGSGKPMRSFGEWDGQQWRLHGDVLTFPVLWWYPLPEAPRCFES